MTQQLFRKEALQAKQTHYLGTIRIGRNPNFGAVTAVAVLLAAALIAFAVWGEVTRKARLTGLLAPTLGTLNLTTTQAGTLIELRVNEGDVVQVGQLLMRINTDRGTTEGGTAALIAGSLQQRRATLEAERKLDLLQTQQRQQALADRLRSNDSEQVQAHGELDGVERRLQLAAKSVERYQVLAKEGFVADIQAQQKQEELLDLGTHERNARRMLTTLARDAQSLRAEQVANASALQTQLTQIDRSLASLA